MFRRVCLILLSACAVLSAGAQTAPGDADRKPAVVSQEQLISYLKASEAAMKPWLETKLNVQEKDISIPDLLAKFKGACKLDIRLTAGALAHKVILDLDFTDSTAWDVLDFIAEYAKYEFVVDREGSLWLALPEEVESLSAPGWREAGVLHGVASSIEFDRSKVTEPESYGEIRGQIDLMESTLTVKDVPLGKALEELSRQTGLTFELDSSCSQDPHLLKDPINPEFRDRPLKEILDALCAAQGLDWFVTASGARLARPEVAKEERGVWVRWENERIARTEAETKLLAREVRVWGEDLSAGQIAAALEKELGVPCRTDLETWNSDLRWTMPDRSRPAAEIVRELKADDRLMVGYRGGVLWIVAGSGG